MATPLITRPLGVNDTGLPAVPISLQEVITHLAMRPREARAFVADLADAIIQEQDRFAPDPDLEESGDEREPSLGALTKGITLDRYARRGRHGNPVRTGETSQADWSRGGLDDVEHVDEDGGDIQSEPHDGHDVEDACMSEDISRGEDSLGWGNGVNQLRLGMPSNEYEHTAPERHGGGFIQCVPDDAEDDDDAEPNGDELDVEFEEDHRFLPRTEKEVDAYFERKPDKVSVDRVATLKGVYAMVCRGDCMQPLIHNHTKLVMDATQTAKAGDLVVVWLRTPDGKVIALAKRLVSDVPGEGSSDWLVYEMLNPGTVIALRFGEWVAVHKIVGTKNLDGALDTRLIERNASFQRVRQAVAL